MSSRRPFTLAWSSLEKYEACGLQFLWSRGWGNIDVGGGPGRRQPPPVKQSREHSVMGSAVGKAVEDFYNLKLYATPDGLKERLGDIAEDEFFKLLDKEYVDWSKAPSRTEMLEVVRSSAENFLTTVKFDKLLGHNARAEVEYRTTIDERTPINGRSDIEFTRADTGYTILDGKNGKTKGKYTDPDQLRWYALCSWLQNKVVPDRLGFVYFRYPADPEKNQSGVDWIDCTMSDLEGLAQRAVQALESMRKEVFDANPVASNCRLCDYESVCEARQQSKVKRQKSKLDLDSVLQGMTDPGVLDFTFDDVPAGKRRKGG